MNKLKLQLNYKTNGIPAHLPSLHIHQNLTYEPQAEQELCVYQDTVIYWVMILTYKYRFVVLLCIRSFVTYSWLCNMNVRSWIEMGIYMDKYICDNVLGCEVSTRVHVWPYEMCAMADVIPGGTSVSWQTQSSCSACGPYVRFWWIRRLGKCTGMPLIL